MHTIPLTFTLSGQTVHGFLFGDYPKTNRWWIYQQYKVQALGCIYLMPNYEWVVKSYVGGLEGQEDYFEQVLISWYQ